MIRFPPRNILVPLDGYEGAYAAWEQALFFADAFGSRVQALHVPGWMLGAQPWAGEAALQSFDMTRAIEDTVGKGKVVTLSGEPASAIADWADGQGFDLVVMGSHGYTGVARLLMGSVSEGVVRRARVPVLVARCVKRRFKSVLAPVHFSPRARHGLAAAAEVAQALAARLHIVSVLPRAARGDVELLARIDRYLAETISRLPPGVRRVCAPTAAIIHGEPVEEIVREARAHDLVAILEHDHHSWAESFAGTTAERVARTSPAPVLALPMTVPAASVAGEPLPHADPFARPAPANPAA